MILVSADYPLGVREMVTIHHRPEEPALGNLYLGSYRNLRPLSLF